jgi:hypothetical protein
MLSTLALHLGAHKTATTTLQRAFDSRRRELLRLGTGYLGPGDLRDEPGLVFPRPEMAADRVAQVQGRTARLLDTLVPAALGARRSRLLVSEENIIGTPRLMLRHAALYPGLTARLGALPADWDMAGTHVFLSIRDYAGFFASCHSTVAQQGVWVPFGAEERAALARMPRRWPDVVADIRATLPAARLTVWRYEELHATGQAVVEAMAGGPFEIDLAGPGAMGALSAGAMAGIAAASAAAGGARLPGAQVRRIRQDTEGSGPYDPWEAETRAALSNLYAEDCARIGRMDGVDLL